MSTSPVALPYFDYILERLHAGDPDVTAAFGRHVHWGYWDDPARADGTLADFAAATEALSRQVIATGRTGGGRPPGSVGLRAAAGGPDRVGLLRAPLQAGRDATLWPQRHALHAARLPPAGTPRQASPPSPARRHPAHVAHLPRPASPRPPH